MQMEFSGFLAGQQCIDLVSNGFSRVDTHSGSIVCRYPIEGKSVSVWDTGLQLLGTSECEHLKAEYDQQQQTNSS